MTMKDPFYMYLFIFILFHYFINTCFAVEYPQNCQDMIYTINALGYISDINNIDKNKNHRIEYIFSNKIVQGITEEEEARYYWICIPKHPHQHNIILNLTILNGSACMYISCEHLYPTIKKWSWSTTNIKSRKTQLLEIATYLTHFPRDSFFPINMYISIYGFLNHTHFVLTYQILDLPNNSDIRSREAYYNKERKRVQRYIQMQEVLTKYNRNDKNRSENG